MYFEDLDVNQGKFTKTMKKVQDAVYGFLDSFGIYFIIGFCVALAAVDILYLYHAFRWAAFQIVFLIKKNKYLTLPY